MTAACLAGCDGDDVNPALPDSGAPDATTQAPGKDAGGGGSDAGVCVSYDAAALSDAEVHEGIAIVVAEQCQRCHGESLSGNDDGVFSPGYGTAYPPNLTPDPVTGLGCWTDSQIEEAFLHGIDDKGSKLCPPMPHFGEFDDGGGIDEAGAAAVVAFLRSLPAIVNDVPASPNCNEPPDSGPSEDAGTPVDGGHHHRDGGSEDGGATDGGNDATVQDGGAEDASSEDATTDAGTVDGAANEDGGD